MSPRFARRVLVAGSAFVALLTAGVVALYQLTIPASAIPKGNCTLTSCGPLMFADCYAQFDGPLLVYTRFPERFIADCGYWSNATSGAWFCSTLSTMTSACFTSSAPNSASLSDAYTSPLRAQRGAAKRER
jgi:hypothetical protein